MIALLVALAPSVLPQAPADTGLALGGLDPVALCSGEEVAGKEELALDRHVFHYRFASEASRAEFEADPERYEIQLGGGCARMGPLSGLCDSSHWAVHDARIYVFASADCRASFLAAPERHLEADDPEPTFDEASAAAGKELLGRVLGQVGGAQRVDSVQTYVRSFEQIRPYEGKEVRVGHGVTVDFAGSARPRQVRTDSYWGDLRTERCALSEGAGFSAGSSSVRPLHPAQRALMLRELDHDLLVLLRARNEPGFHVGRVGSAIVVDGVTVEELWIWFEGAATTLFVEAETGAVLRSAWRGRDGTGPNGAIAVDWSDVRPVNGLMLPFTQRATFDGAPAGSLSLTWSAVRVDGELAPDTFAVPKR